MSDSESSFLTVIESYLVTSAPEIFIFNYCSEVDIRFFFPIFFKNRATSSRPKSITIMTKGGSRNTMKPNLGVGATCKVQFRHLHPRKVKEDKFMNMNHKDNIEGLLAMRADAKKINRIERRCVIFRHPLLDDSTELHSAATFVHVLTPGHPEHFFSRDDVTTVAATENNENIEENAVVDAVECTEDGADGVELPIGFHHSTSRREDIDLFRSMGLDVDDDDDPVPENVPEPTTNQTPAQRSDGLKENQSWGWSGIDTRKDFFRTTAKV